MKNLINILFIMMCIGIQAQETLPKTSFEIEFNSMELSEVVGNPADKQFNFISQKEHYGKAFFHRTDSGYVVTIKSDKHQLEPFELVFDVTYPIELSSPENAWQFNDVEGDFILFCDSSSRWVYLYAKCIQEYIQFKKYGR